MNCCCFSNDQLRQWSLYSCGWTLLQSIIGTAFGITWIVNSQRNIFFQTVLLALSLFGIICSCILLSAVLTKNNCTFIPWLLLIGLVVVLGCVGFIGSILSADFLIGAIIGLILITDAICFWIVLLYYDGRCEKTFRRSRRHY